MSKPESDPVYVRASVWPRCDLVCRYCPVDEGMENRTPQRLTGRENRLRSPDYLANLAAIAQAGVRGVSFTGGEPTLRADLGDLLTGARPFFERVELTTNGANLRHAAEAVKWSVDLLKVSLDAVDADDVTRITGRGHGHAQARAAIDWAVGNGVPLGINTVLMQSTADQLTRTIAFARELTRAATAQVHLSLLDFYFTPSRRAEWEGDYLPVDGVLDLLSAGFGEPVEQERFGCRFWWFDADGLQVRVKDSWSATMRAPKCTGCASYCQEGVYGVKHSAEGWFTTCPSDREDLGTHLGADLNSEERLRRVRTVLYDVEQAVSVPGSFERMIEVHQLRPRHVVSTRPIVAGTAERT